VTVAIVAAVVVIAIVVLIARFAIRGLRKFVRSVWPHS
jgi:hypothetical protein